MSERSDFKSFGWLGTWLMDVERKRSWLARWVLKTKQRKERVGIRWGQLPLRANRLVNSVSSLWWADFLAIDFRGPEHLISGPSDVSSGTKSAANKTAITGASHYDGLFPAQPTQGCRAANTRVSCVRSLPPAANPGPSVPRPAACERSPKLCFDHHHHH
jgi:hypothetical protein